jgi:1-acyl-sn-glycerol-3-phosphate acyltransferase
MIFPEGTRSSTDEMLPFKDGAFRLAIDTQVPILPMVVAGSRTALAKRSWRVNRSRAEVRVLEPVSVEGLKKTDVAALREKVFAIISAERERMRAER